MPSDYQCFIVGARYKYLYINTLAPCPTKTKKNVLKIFYFLRSSIGASGAFFLTDSMPFSRAETEEYISLVPKT